MKCLATTFLIVLAAACSSAPATPPTGRVERVVHFRHVTPAAAVEGLMGLGAPYQVSLHAKNDGTLVVSGDAQSVERVVQALAELDVPQR